MKSLSKRQIILLHEQLITETGGTHGLRDEEMLESALSAPFQEFQATHLIRRSSRKRPGWAMA